MLVTTTMNVEGRQIETYLGVVRGLIVRTPNIVQGFLGGLKSIVGGQIQAYAEMCEQARQEAYSLMVQHAGSLNADAIIGMRFDASDVGKGCTEILCYGTAVKLKGGSTN